jgi:bifunctional DNA-binding transcriptional regulator/antitoxin component of YhaV-PrlF toxin-antitoxin module
MAELLHPQAPPQWSYVISRADRSGRVMDRSIVRAIGWGPGDRLTITGWHNEAVIVRRESGGTIVISDRGYLQIPSGLRRRCAVRGGDRVLVAAHERLDTVIVYTMSTLDRLMAVESEVLLFGVRA